MSEWGITRRHLLTGALGAAGGLLAVAAMPSLLLSTPTRTLAQLTQAMFEAEVGTTFKVAGARATLTTVAAFERPPGTAGTGEAFTLFFDGPDGLRAGIHDIEHPRLGRFQMHLDEAHRAVFNRMWA